MSTAVGKHLIFHLISVHSVGGVSLSHANGVTTIFRKNMLCPLPAFRLKMPSCRCTRASNMYFPAVRAGFSTRSLASSDIASCTRFRAVSHQRQWHSPPLAPKAPFWSISKELKHHPPYLCQSTSLSSGESFVAARPFAPPISFPPLLIFVCS